VEPNLFETANAGFAQAMYEEFLRDPAAVGAEWRRLFESGVVGERPAVAASNGRGTAATPAPAGATLIKGPAARLVQNMAESLTVPTATTFRELPVATLESRRKELNAALQAAGRSEKISFTHIIAWAIVQATKQHPMMGHTLRMQEGAPYRVVPDGISLGLAVDVTRKDGSRGLVVPVIKHAEAMDFSAFHAAYAEILRRHHGVIDFGTLTLYLRR
jgi:2-oxoglutarate dehydrogenase E1 component